MPIFYQRLQECAYKIFNIQTVKNAGYISIFQKDYSSFSEFSRFKILYIFMIVTINAVNS